MSRSSSRTSTPAIPPPAPRPGTSSRRFRRALEVTWDPGNAQWRDEVPYPGGHAAIPKGRIGHVHCKDAARRADGKGWDWMAMGRGMIDWAGQFRALKNDGYPHACALETHWRGAGTPEAFSRESVAGMKGSWEARERCERRHGAMHVGLIGAGNISDTHARALGAISDVEIAAIYAPTRAHAEQLAKRHGAAAFDSLDGLLAHRPLDMVVVGSPSGLHAEHGIAAAERGVHVLVEKPIDVTTARADALIEEAERAGVTLGVIFQDRLKPDVRRLKGLVEAGRLGTPILANARVKWYRPPSYYRDSRWRGTRALDGGGALMNQGVHTVDLLVWLFGPVRRVFAKTIAGLHAIEVEDTAVAVLEFANGAIGTLEAATSAYPGYSRQIELTGSNGTLMLDGDALAAIDLQDARDSERPTRPGAATASSASPVVADPAAHVRVFEDFISAVARRLAPCCDGSSGRQSVALVEAIYQSARTNLPVELLSK